jgi:hypothetical protein
MRFFKLNLFVTSLSRIKPCIFLAYISSVNTRDFELYEGLELLLLELFFFPLLLFDNDDWRIDAVGEARRIGDL